MKAALLIAVALVCCMSGAHAAFRDGNNLHRLIQADARADGNAPSRKDFADANELIGYVEAISDALEVAGNSCVPAGSKLGQIEAVVAKYVEAHPEKWGESAAQLIANAIHKGFPCAPK